MRRERTVGYIHTIDGKPARFDGEQTCYCSPSWPVLPVKTLRQIRREQRVTREYRVTLGPCGSPGTWAYGYVRIVEEV